MAFPIDLIDNHCLAVILRPTCIQLYPLECGKAGSIHTEISSALPQVSLTSGNTLSKFES